MISNKTTIFWDNDGILVDTEKYYFEATAHIMRKEGFELTKEIYIEYFLIKATGAWHLLDQKQYSEASISKLRKERDILYNKLLLSNEIMVEGIKEIVSGLSRKYKMAIVTSSKPNHFKAIHKRTGLLKYFSFAITPDNYSNYKPHPEPYLLALKKMEVKASESIAIEDSLRGLIAAKAAELDCIVIPGELTANSDFSKADYVLSSINQLSELF